MTMMADHSSLSTPQHNTTTSDTSTAPVGVATADKAAVAKLSAQLKKLTEANGKYKNLLKLAKERIQQQEEELDKLQVEKSALEERLVSSSDEKDAAGQVALDDTIAERTENLDTQIVRVCLRVKTRASVGDLDEIWALIEFEAVSNGKDGSDDNSSLQPPATRRYKEWRRFDTESELKDFIRRDTGEPLTIPPYSLSPDESDHIQNEAAQKVTQITEEFRRFRIRAELQRKQADAQIRDLQNSNVQSAARRIEGQDRVQMGPAELDQLRLLHAQLERQRAEFSMQQSQWKETYDTLTAENTALKSEGSASLLASQWRQRYEACAKEKEDLEARLKIEVEHAEADNYEAKYKDLKESFKLYRAQAKEIFNSQQQNGTPLSPTAAMNIHGSSAESKLAYLKNLMVNYLTSDQGKRGHMESAIGTVLEFSPEEVERIEKKKAENESWF